MSLNSGETIMRCEMAVSMLLSFSIFGLASITFATNAPAQVACSGHKLLPIPRPESSCSDVKPQIYPSPDGALRALVFPVDVSLYATPDMESRVVIRSSNSDTPDLEGLFLAARRQWILCRQRKMVARLAILRLQHVVVRRPFALVISDDGI